MSIVHFLHNIIPVETAIWLCFFIIPGTLSLVGQIVLCWKYPTLSWRSLPALLAFAIMCFVMVYRAVPTLQLAINGFYVLFLMFSSVFILGGSMLGWILYAVAHRVKALVSHS